MISDRWDAFTSFRLAISCIRHPCIVAITFLRDLRGNAKITKADELSRNGCVLSSLILSDCGTATFDTYHFKRIRLQSRLRYPTTVKYMFYIVFVPRLELNQGGSECYVFHIVFNVLRRLERLVRDRLSRSRAFPVRRRSWREGG